MKSIILNSLKMFFVAVLVIWAQHVYAQGQQCADYLGFENCFSSGGYNSCTPQMSYCSENCHSQGPPIAYELVEFYCYPVGDGYYYCEEDQENFYGPNNNCQSQCVYNFNQCMNACYSAFCL
jgi:hypothetical protein